MRAYASPTRSGPEGSSRNEPRLGRCPASHLFLVFQYMKNIKNITNNVIVYDQSLAVMRRKLYVNISIMKLWSQ